MKRVSISIIIFFYVTVGVSAKTVELTLYSAKVPESTQKLQLMPKVEQQIDEDATPLYEKAIESMPKDLKREQMRQWLKLPIEQFPQKEAEETIQKCIESLRLVSRAARCKECKWPDLKPGTQPVDFDKYSELMYILELWARLEISRGQFNGAVVAMRRGFGMARHLGQAPTSSQVQRATAVGEVMCREVEQLMQGKDSPNLYWALANLPRPLVDMEKAIENDLQNLKEYNFLIRRQLEKQLKPFHDRMRMIQRRANTRLNALQAVEAIRNYAAIHEGLLPETLSDISDVEVPKDLVSGEMFEYRRTDAGAILKSAIPEGGDERDSTQYEIVLKK